MNRKGQVLAGFLLLLPFLLVLFVYIIDLGNMYISKRHVENNVKDAIHYGLKQEELNEEVQARVEELLRKNISNIEDLDIVLANDTLKVHIVVKEKAVFATILNKHIYKVDVTYLGYIENERIKIIKE